MGEANMLTVPEVDYRDGVRAVAFLDAALVYVEATDFIDRDILVALLTQGDVMPPKKKEEKA